MYCSTQDLYLIQGVEVGKPIHVIIDQPSCCGDLGLSCRAHREPPVKGAVLHFDEFTEEGSLGYATLATKEKGARIFEAAVGASTVEIQRFAEGFVLIGIEPRS